MSDKTYDVIGVMSGTSVDGLDLAFCRFQFLNDKWNYTMPFTKSIPYSHEWQDKLLKIISSPADEILITDIEFGKFIADQINLFISEYELKPSLIASHGHTVFHQPSNKISFQIGNGLVINLQTGVTTINNFRQLDVILGGQGAPLVPIGDRLLFPEFDICLNIGGFSNISYEKETGRMACDICPANIVLNRISRKAGHQYDDKGSMARYGKLIPELYNELNDLDFYKQASPKSLGLEWVKEIFFPLVDKYHDAGNILNTLTCHIANQISTSIRKIADEKKLNIKVLASGGGVYNDFLMELLEQNSGGKVTYIKPDKSIIDFKEALIFAFLGLLRFRGEINTLKTVTGANRDSVGGVIYDNHRL